MILKDQLVVRGPILELHLPHLLQQFPSNKRGVLDPDLSEGELKIDVGLGVGEGDGGVAEGDVGLLGGGGGGGRGGGWGKGEMVVLGELGEGLEGE